MSDIFLAYPYLDKTIDNALEVHAGVNGGKWFGSGQGCERDIQFRFPDNASASDFLEDVFNDPRTEAWGVHEINSTPSVDTEDTDR